MRTIKFRAWDGEKMIYPPKQRILNPWLVGAECLRTDVGTMKLMQYTGLKDKNGEEIYEGDIVRHVNYKECKCDEISKIVYLNSNCLTCSGFVSIGTSGMAQTHTHCEHIEVIGNIYENPELIENYER